MASVKQIKELIQRRYTAAAEKMEASYDEKVDELEGAINKERGELIEKHVKREEKPNEENKYTSIVDLGNGEYFVYPAPLMMRSRKIDDFEARIETLKREKKEKLKNLKMKKDELLDKVLLDGVSEELKETIKEVFG